MKRICTILTLINISFIYHVQCESSELLSVTVLYRHGCRAPRKLYKNDPYNEKASEIWPEGFGQLTNTGKNQAFALGQWYRKKYKNFIPEKYSPKFLRVLSSDRDRCLMSAASNLAGLFPPQNEQIWNPNIPWQPIPIHTTPAEQDGLIATDEIYCKRYKKLYTDLMQSQEVLKFTESKKILFQYLSHHTGDNVSTIHDLITLHDALFVESYYNLTLPDWTKAVFPHDTFPIMNMNYALDTNTTEMGRLKSGLLINYITTFFEDVLQNPHDSQKFLMLSGHDSTIARLMNVLKVYDYTWAEYASTLVFELRRQGNQEFIRVYFKDSTKSKDIKLPKCQLDCDFKMFKNIIKPFRLNTNEWEKECSSD